MQFYPADWIKDTQILTPISKAAWIDILCQLWISPTPGKLTWNRLSFTTYLRLTYDENTELVVAELSRVSNLTLTDSDGNEVDKFKHCTWITIVSRRIVNDWEALQRRKDTHKKYNDKRTRYKRQTNDSKTTPIYQKSEVRSQKSQREEEDNTSHSTNGAVKPDELIALYNQTVNSNFPNVEKVTEGRLKKARQYLKQFPNREFWLEVFSEMNRSPFLAGKAGKNGHESFRANFDWLLTKGKDGTENVVKVYEGRYREER